METFHKLLKKTLEMEYRPSFDVDAAFYFGDSVNTQDLLDSLHRHIENLERTISHIQHHQKETIQYIPPSIQVSANIIFQHHLTHYKAELAWAKQSVNSLKEADHSGKNESH